MEPQLKNSSVLLSISLADGTFKTVELKDDSLQTVEYQGELNYSCLPGSIKICRFAGFVAGLNQKIIIREMTMNGRLVETGSFFNFLDFSVKDNEFVSDKLMSNCREVSFNGELLLSVEKNRDRLFWCPYYYSSKKDDFVFINDLADDYGSGIRRYVGDDRNSTKRYKNIPHHEYENQLYYAVACFGCSVTYGTGLDTRFVWPSLISSRSLNLSVPSLGVDGVFLNLKNALKKFHFDNIVVLLPNFERRLARLQLPEVGGFCRIPITTGHAEWSHNLFKHWAWDQVGIHFNQDRVAEWKKEYNKKFMGLLRDEDCVYGKRVLSMLLRLCNSTDKKIYFSSWDQEVYNHLIDAVEMSNVFVLPFFKTIDRALDNIHPGVASHAAWADEVFKIMGVGSKS